MLAISLKLPDDLVAESNRLAEHLGITRTELIRQALRHELQRIRRQQEQQAIAASLRAMRDDPNYLAETESLDERLGDTLPEDEEEWWAIHSR
jgi:metal-responsive CopG/Arc/MetJ family transcriptional regulator